MTNKTRQKYLKNMLFALIKIYSLKTFTPFYTFKDLYNLLIVGRKYDKRLSSI